MSEATDGATPGDQAAADGDAVELARLRRELDEQRELAQSHFRNWQRAQADLSNYRKRAEQEREEQARRAAEEFIRGLLPMLDDLDRAFVALPPDMLRFTWVHGIHLINHKLRLSLEAHGVTPIGGEDDAEPVPFDPLRHEPVLQEEVEPERDGQVLAVLQRGYLHHGRVIRPALVKIGIARREPTAEPAPTGPSQENPNP